MLLGLTGCSGTGTTTVAGVWQEQGASICSLDLVGHRFLSKRGIRSELEGRLGMKGLSGMDSESVRKELRHHAFSDPGVLGAVNDTLHPRLRKWVAYSAGIIGREKGVFVLDAALVFELELENILDLTITVKDTMQRATERLQKRDSINMDTAAGRWQNQMDIREKCRKSHFVIDNCGTISDLRNKAIEFYRDVIKKMEDANWHTKPERN